MTDTRKAAKAFNDFTGARASKVKRSHLDDRDVTGWKMGPMVGVAYEATRDGKTQQYFHEFKKSARPDLVARDDGKRLYIDGGRYKVTDRGVEDMPALFVVNPSPRHARGKTMAVRRRRRVARRAAPKIVYRRNPARRRKRRTSQVAIFRANPARRRRSYRRNPIRRVGRRMRRNPSARAAMGGALSFGKFLLPAAGIGAGAVLAEVAMGYLPIPANFKTGVLRHVTKGVVGVGLGMAVGKIFRQKRLGNFIALGAVVIAVHDGIKELITSRMPGVPMGRGMGAYMPPGIIGSMSSFGYYTPGQVTGSLGGDSTQHGDGASMQPAFGV